ncbi:photosystem II repair protein Psb32 [Capilliphycus salinus ALCB114379]|uniref:photosystem II repair protein Psb32 n=1 Tax=Capilliphycus salinus TaxID=2768948 RepID=UPI0039A6A7FB
MIQLFNKILNWKKRFVALILPTVLAVFIAQLWATPAQATGVYQMPNLTSGDPTRIVDDGDVLSFSTERQINQELSQLTEKTGYEVRLVTLRRFDYGETADSFTEALFNKWFPTPEAGENQTLLVLDVLTNNSAIRSGEGAKSLLTDEIAESVATETLQVPLRDGNKYNEAFKGVSDRLVAVLSGNPDPGPPSVNEQVQIEGTFKSAEETDDQTATIIVVIVLVVATVAPMATYFYFQRS